MRICTRRLKILAASAAVFCVSVPARADVIVLDQNTVGTLYDGLLDGFPSVFTFDGIADGAGNALAVALQDGVTEERAIGEIALQSLIDAGVTASDVDEAVLTFNIDDVLSTFGPGTTFDGAAAETIVLFNYAGNGTIDLADYENVVGAPLAVVDTVAEATLAGSGPVFFDVDVTAALKAHLDAGESFMGIVWATQDDGSGTSLDDLGDGSAGPPGVGGSSMPSSPSRRSRARRRSTARLSSPARRRSARRQASLRRPLSRRSPSASTRC